MTEKPATRIEEHLYRQRERKKRDAEGCKYHRVHKGARRKSVPKSACSRGI